MKKRYKIIAFICSSPLTLIVLIFLALGVASMILTPERLTRLVREYGTEYLVDGKVDVKSVDLSIWSTFPHAVLTVDSLVVENNAVPDEYRRVVSVGNLSGRLNLAALLIGRISISNARIIDPQITLWQGADSTQSSLSILPPGSDDEDSDEPLSLPDLHIKDFRIGGDARARYVSEPDSLNATVQIAIVLSGKDETPQYAVEVTGNALALPHLTVPLIVSANGGIGWKPSEPLAVSLHDFLLGIDRLSTRTSLRADFSDGIRIDALDFELQPLPLQRLTELADSMPALAGMIPAVNTPATLAVSAKLHKPYVYDPDTLLMPDMTIRAVIDDAPIDVPAYYLTLTNLGMKLKATLSDAGLDASTVELERLKVEFPSSDFTLEGTATNLATDPAVKGCFKGDVNFSRLNPRLWTLLGMRLSGALSADVDVDTRLSYLSPNEFHRMRLSGDARLHDFSLLMPADTIAAGITHATLRFGSENSFHGVDSMLMATLRVDSARVFLPDLDVSLKDLTLGAGVSNTSASADTTTVTPMGGRLSVKALTYRSVSDSSRAMVRNLEGGVSLSRFRGNDRAPQLGAKLTAKRLVYADGTNRASLRGIDIAASAHVNARKQGAKRTLSRRDSMQMTARRDSMLLSQSGFERLDVGVDRKAVQMLRRMNVSGHVIAQGGRVMTPLFPLRTRLNGLNMTFNADSVMLNALKLTAGHSDFSLDGSITNIQKALGSRAATQPLKLALTLSSDTINVNELTQAAFRGAAYAAKADSLTVLQAAVDLTADDDTLEADADADASDEIMAIVVPMNIDATFNVNAANIIYSTLDLKDFRGEVLVANGAANLRDLHAATDIGSVDLNMLYYAPTRQDVNFGMGIDLKRFNIGRVTELMPTLDSIMPILNTLGGIIDVSISATTPVDSAMNIDIPQLRAMVHLSGDSLKVLDEQTFKTVSKWLLFHDKNKNMIDHMDVHLAVDDNQLSLYPFMFDFDRYRIGVMGNNDLAMNLDYHVSILKSPVPFKFGINIKGNTDKMKIRLGRARFKENMAAETRQLSDTLRLNLANEIRDVFSRGAKSARLAPLEIRRPRPESDYAEAADTLSAADSLFFRQQGLIDTIPTSSETLIP